MAPSIHRLRMVAGPNGSGKSTVKSFVDSRVALMWGLYINPDDIEQKMLRSGQLDLKEFQVTSTSDEIRHFFLHSALLQKENLTQIAKIIRLHENCLEFEKKQVNSYLASVIADFIRQKLVEKRCSFTFETVMSSEDKIRFLQHAKTQGYRTYLYYVATIDPALNIDRVRDRVKKGGHDVPRKKIIDRYHRSLEFLLDAIHQTDRAYIFDNSSQEMIWIAEITDGRNLEIKNGWIPQWFETAVLKKLH